jgi:hypothetical protein
VLSGRQLAPQAYDKIARHWESRKPMHCTLAQISAVVVGMTHNPTILNPDFLAIRGIVPGDWEVEATITTPPMSFVRYKNGLSVTVEHEKLQVIDARNSDLNQSKVAEIAAAYVRMLPHVRYSAVGINFQATVEHDAPDRFLKQRFVKSGAWDTPGRPLEAVGLRFAYSLSDGKLVLSLDAGESASSGNNGQHVLILNCNFHRDCVHYPADAVVIGHLNRMAEDHAIFLEICRDVLESDFTET